MEKIADPKTTDTKTFKARFYSGVKGGKNRYSRRIEEKDRRKG